MEDRECLSEASLPEDQPDRAQEEEVGENTHKLKEPEISPSVPDSLSALEHGIAHTLHPLLAEIAGLRRDFETKVKYDESKERIIESLHRELQLHQQGLHFRVLQPVFMDLITLYDDIEKVLAWINAETLTTSEQTTRHLRIFQGTVEEILRRQGVEPFTQEEEVFLPQRQRSVSIVPTTDPTLDKQIARRVRCGFHYDEKILRYELVEIYKYKPIEE